MRKVLIMNIIYSFAMVLYAIGTYIAALFNPKARARVNGLKTSLSGLKKVKKEWGDAPVVWFHCASLGEFEQGRPLLEAFKEQSPKHKIVLSFFSSSGYEIRKNYALADYITYLPFDLPWQARTWAKLLSPEYVFFIKYEYWANLLRETRNTGAKLYLVAAIFKPEQIFFKPYGGFFRNILRQFDALFVQNEDSLKLLDDLNLNVHVTGDTRFDRVITIAKQAKKLDFMDAFASGHETFISGSTWPKDEALLAEVLDAEKDIKLVMVPHEISEEGVQRMIKLFPSRKALRYTQLEGNDPAQFDLLIIDTVGLLSSVYRYGKYAYIGGGFGVGIHNTLEAAVYGIPVFFGPNYKKFQEACNLISTGGGFSCAQPASLKEILDLLRQDAAAYTRAAGAAGDLVALHAGATEKIIKTVLEK